MSMDIKPTPGGARSEVAVAVEELRSAAAFLTRLPERLTGHDSSRVPDFRHGARVFPVVGALVGAAGGVVLIAAAWLGMPFTVAAALAIAATIALTGALHEDGLADMADSFGGMTRERKLEIMDDSRIGTYGALALVFSIGLRVLALASIAASVGPFRAALTLIAAEAVARAALVRLWHDLPAAKAGGLSSETGAPDQNAMLIAIAGAAVVAILLCVPSLGLWPTLIAGLLAGLAAWGMVRLTARTLGGRTGDTLGASEQVALVAFLVGASTV